MTGNNPVGIASRAEDQERREYKYEGIFTSWQLIMVPTNKYLNSVVSTVQ